MKITAIKAQVKRSDRYSVFVDEKYSFSLSSEGLLESRLVSGQDLTESEVADLKRKSADDKVYGLALRYVAIRLRSRYELETYLSRKEAPPELIERILQRLEHFGFVNDETFARSWVDNRRLLKATSRRRLQMELRQKRIADDIIRKVLEEDQTTDRATLMELVAKKRRQTRFQDDTKLMQYLARQGYSYDDIKHVMQNVGDND